MLCFDLYGQGIEILLCEETIRYSAYRHEGIRLAATVVARVPEEAAGQYLHILHPRHLSKVALRSTRGDQNVFSYVFSHIVQKRLTPVDGETQLLRQWETGKHSIDSKTLKVRDLQNPNGDILADALDLADKAVEFVPYTCFKIGPLPHTPEPLIFGLEGVIDASSFEDLTGEDRSNYRRKYKVYGPSYTRQHIDTIFLPESERFFGEAQNEAVKEFVNNQLPRSNRICPERYSVVALDNPNCNPFRMRAVEVSEELESLTDRIDSGIYEHKGLHSIRDRIHWYVTRDQTDSFFLDFIGPIARPDEAYL